jgi:5-(carboxyamino)imidazole ribonucleotide mutase
MEKIMSKPRVLIVLGSDSDLPIMKNAKDALGGMGVDGKIVISSAHRTPERTATLAKTARDEGFEVIIAGAGMAAHLAGAIAANTTLPVIGVPLTSKASSLNGMDSLLSTVQMPSGIPVATVGIDNAKNAALLACSMLSIKYPDLIEKLDEMKTNMAKELEKKSAQIEGYQ